MNQSIRRGLALCCAALLLALPALAQEENWYEREAVALTQRMALLSTDEAYLTLMGGGREVLETIEALGLDAAPEPSLLRAYVCQDAASALETLMPDAAFTEVGRQEAQRRMLQMAPSLANGAEGALWVAATAMLGVSATYPLPQGDLPHLALVDLDGEVGGLVSFVPTGEDTLTASAILVKVASVTDEALAGLGWTPLP